MTSPSSSTPIKTQPARASIDASPPPSPFSVDSPYLNRPALAHLSAQSNLHRPLPPPPLRSFSGHSQPLSTLSDTHAHHVDLYRPDGSAYSPPRQLSGIETSGMQRSTSADSPSSPSSFKGKGRASVQRERRSSVGSLQGLMERDEASRGTASSGNFDFLRRASSRQSSGESLPPIDDEAASGGGAESAAQVAQLSWGSKWWPFSVVGPEGQESSETSTPGSAAVASRVSGKSGAGETKGGEDDSLGFLSLFAGKKTAQEAHAEAAEQARQDQFEAELLEADVEDLRRIIETSTAQEANEQLPPLPPKRVSLDDKALPPSPTPDRSTSAASAAAAKAASLLPSLSLFSSSTTSPSRDSASASLSSITSHAVAAEQAEAATKAASSSKSSSGATGGSLLSSLTLSNPFTNASAGSLFSSAPFSTFSSTSSSPPTDAPRPPSLAHTRSFSSTSLSRRRSTGSASAPSQSASNDRGENDDGQSPSKREVKGMVSDADKQAIEQGYEENDDMYSVLKDKYKAPRLPVVFCHGLFGFDYIGPQGLKPLRVSYWIGVEEALQAMGAEVMIGRVPASASIEERATVLCQMIEERFAGREVNLIGHSMGGLDGRYLISRIQPKTFKVRSLTTISTPHRGSSFADYLLENILGAEKVPAFLAVMRGLGVPGGGKAFDDLTTTKMARFNEDTPDDPNVKYYSYGAEFVASWSNPFFIPYGIIAKREGPNDGLVSVQSAKWGQYMATLHNVNHLDLVGWTGKIRYGMAQLWGVPIRYRPISFYSAVAEHLAEEGF